MLRTGWPPPLPRFRRTSSGTHARPLYARSTPFELRGRRLLRRKGQRLRHSRPTAGCRGVAAMLRVASAARLLRRAQGCALPLLSDAAAAHGARSAAERSSAAGLGADSALQSWRTAHRRLSAAATTPAAVVCACVLERLPIVLPPQPAWETEYQVRVLSAALASPPRVAGAWLKVHAVSCRTGGTRSCATRSRSTRRHACVALAPPSRGG